MNKIILPNQQQVDALTQPDICIKIAGVHHKLLIDFLIHQRITFSILPVGEDTAITYVHQMEDSLPTFTAVSGETRQTLENVYAKYILKSINTPPNIEDIAEEIGWSISKFKTRFKAYYGKPFYQIYMDQKMKYAAKLLKEGYKAMDVSEKVGYSQPIKFSKTFQKYFGVTPHKYKKQ